MCIEVHDIEIVSDIGYKLFGLSDGKLHSPFRNAGFFNPRLWFEPFGTYQSEDFTPVGGTFGDQPGFHIYIEEPAFVDYTINGLSFINDDGTSMVVNQGFELWELKFSDLRLAGSFGGIRAAVVGRMHMIQCVRKFAASPMSKDYWAMERDAAAAYYANTDKLPYPTIRPTPTSRPIKI